jgi:hypothetical protein
MRKTYIDYSPERHEGSTNTIGAAYHYVIATDSIGTFSNYKNGERVAGLTGRDLAGNWKRFRIENIIRVSGI